MSDRQRAKKPASKHRRTATERDGALTLSATVKSVLVALPITVAVGLLLLFIATLLLLRTDDPGHYYTAVGLILLYVTAMAGGAVATRLHRGLSPLLCGSFEAVLLFLFFSVAAICMPRAWQSHFPGGITLLLRLLMLPASLMGAYMVAKRRKKRHHR
ncbi:MAG: hypothetical protein IJY50_03970 [Clostridia bacterium]|nr:hypothetical protein [Clostridia bacterium]